MPARFILLLASLLFLPFPGVREARGWGFSAHRMVVDNARELLPDGLRQFFDSRAGDLRDFALEPDTVLREEGGDREARNHYLNLDLLEPYPFAGIPADLAAARDRFGERKMARAGRLPWRVQELVEELTEDFRELRWEAALIRAGHISHYVADATQPLHGTVNFDGQKTGNHGIHQAFERRMIDRHPDLYRKAARASQEPLLYLERPAEWVLGLLIEAYPHNETILDADRKAVQLVKKEEGEYFVILEKGLRGLAVERLARAGTATASCWATAWIDAGRVIPPEGNR